MGQQQLLLVILGVLIVGIAIAAGLTIFRAQEVQSNKDAIINDMNHLAAYAYQYRLRPKSQNGGAGSYSGFTLPSHLLNNENATYSCTVGADSVVFNAVSVGNNFNTVRATIGSDGKLIQTSWSYTGEFQ